MKLSSRLVLSFSVLVIIPGLLIVFLSIFQVRQQLLIAKQDSLELLANAEKKNVENTLTNYKNRVSGISSRTKFRNLLSQYNSTKDFSIVPDMEKILRDATEPFDDIYNIDLFDSRNALILSTEKSVVSEKVIRPDFKNIDFDTESRKLIFVQSISLRGDDIGLIRVSFSPDLILDVVNDHSFLGDTGEVLIAKRDDFGNAEFIHTRRFENDEQTKAVIDKSSTLTPITQALLKREVAFPDGIDYRGHKVLSTTRYVEEPDWGMVVKIDSDELIKQIRSFQLAMGVVGLVLLLFVVLFSALYSRSIVNPILVLSENVKAFTQGKLSKKIPKDLLTMKDEIGELAKTFEKMRRDLQGLYKSLEKKVKDRTEELEKTKGEVEERLNETERLNKIMVDRELKMVELKKTISDLRSKINSKNK